LAPSKMMNMRSQTKSVEEIRERAWRKLAAAVPRAIKVVTERKTKLEAQIDAGETPSPRAQRELEKIRALLDQHHNQQILIRILLNSIGLEKGSDKGDGHRREEVNFVGFH
jgi:hypothetical protein